MIITKNLSKETATALVDVMKSKTVYFIGKVNGEEHLYNSIEWNKTDEEEVAFVGMAIYGKVNGKSYTLEICEEEEEAFLYYRK